MNKHDLPEVRIPLYRVGEWIATEGGARDLGPPSITFENKNVRDYRFSSEPSLVHARAWDKALPQLLNAMHTRRLRVEGLPGGDNRCAFKEIEPSEFSDAYNNPFRLTPIETILSNHRRLTLHWDTATIDNGGRGIYWSNIQACSREEALALWPAATVKAPSPYIALPDAWEKFAKAEGQTDCEAPAAIDAQLEKFRDAIALPLSKATYCETEGRLKFLDFEDWFETCGPSLLKADWLALPATVRFARDLFDDLDIVKSWQRSEAARPMTDDDVRKWLRAKEEELGRHPPIRTWRANRQFFQERGVTKPSFEQIWTQLYPTARAGRPSKNAPRIAPEFLNAKESLAKPAK